MKTWLATCGIIAPLVIVLPATTAMSPTAVAKIAKSVTVAITMPNERGSGAIIARAGNTYTVLTAAHVVKKNNGRYTIELSDGQKYPVSGRQLAPTGNLDLAIVKFQSDRNYPVVKIGDSNNAVEGSLAYVAGFPLATAAISKSVYTFSDGKITANSSQPFSNGYSIVYSCNTLPGMSGGPVLNDSGELIAVHGRGDIQENKQSDINANVFVKTGFNLGIPANSFLKLASQMGVTLGQTAPVIATQPRNTAADDSFVTAATKFRQGDYPGAIAGFDRAIATKPNYTAAYIARAEANLYLENGAEVIRDANLALRSDPKSADAYALRGAGKIGSGDSEGAFADLDRAISLNPRNSRSYLYRGYAQMQYADPTQALRSINQAIAIDLNLGDAYSVRAVAKYLLGDPQGAESDFQRALQINQKSFLTYVYRGFIQVNAGNKAGFNDLATGIAISPNNPLGYSLRGQAYSSIKDYNRAIAQFDIALKLKPNYDSVYAYRGIVRMQQQQFSQGLADVEKALQINPNSEAGYQGRAVYYINQKDFRRSLADANRAIAINSVSPDSYTLQGVSYFGLGNRTQSKAALQTAARLYQKRGNRQNYQDVMALLRLLS
ncbi:trypsin-like peptidase domain-containing protein [Chamaesiphon sp. OTE_20_metabat_361]|uniref:serine protease n=1 Tax=Chamaesiphon sp. OTE_20_metabat_361 TaxID=2964689 RepID=UPI00286AC583|nr:trypsin-like peptidase domain-containing protein [Chamaesiphon sp. OTE_20_metabat_361]